MKSGKFLIHALKLMNFKAIALKQFYNPKRNTAHLDPSKFSKRLKNDSFNVDGFKVQTTFNSASGKKHIVFLHGGAYVLEASVLHRKIIEQLVLGYNFKVSYVDYPLAPENTFTTTHQVLLKSYLEVIRRYQNDEFYLWGDSAGGGLALAFLMELRDKGVQPIPLKSVLLSPWLDVSMQNQKMNALEEMDPILTLEGLIYTGKQYAGNESELKNPMVSPIFGDFSNLGSILLFVGSNEVFLPDCMDFIKKSKEVYGTSIEYKIGENMVHNWIIFPIPESKKSLERIAQYFMH